MASIILISGTACLTLLAKHLTILQLIMFALARFIASVGVIALILVLSFSPVPANAQLIWERDHDGTVTEVVFFPPDGKTLITGSGYFADSTESLTMRDVDTGEKIAAIEGLAVSSVAISPDGKVIAAGYDRNINDNIQLWDVATQALVATLEGHHAKVFPWTFRWTGQCSSPVPMTALSGYGM